MGFEPACLHECLYQHRRLFAPHHGTRDHFIADCADVAARSLFGGEVPQHFHDPYGVRVRNFQQSCQAFHLRVKRRPPLHNVAFQVIAGVPIAVHCLIGQRSTSRRASGS